MVSWFYCSFRKMESILFLQIQSFPSIKTFFSFLTFCHGQYYKKGSCIRRALGRLWKGLCVIYPVITVDSVWCPWRSLSVLCLYMHSVGIVVAVWTGIWGHFRSKNLVTMPSAGAYVLYLKCRLTGVLKTYPAKLIVFHFKFSGIFHHWLIENTSVSIAFTPFRLSSFKNVPCRCSC